MHIPMGAILELIDIRGYFWPVLMKKYSVLLCFVVPVTGILLTQDYFRWIFQAMVITRLHMVPILFSVFGLH